MCVKLRLVIFAPFTHTIRAQPCPVDNKCLFGTEAIVGRTGAEQRDSSCGMAGRVQPYVPVNKYLYGTEAIEFFDAEDAGTSDGTSEASVPPFSSPESSDGGSSGGNYDSWGWCRPGKEAWARQTIGGVWQPVVVVHGGRPPRPPGTSFCSSEPCFADAWAVDVVAAESADVLRIVAVRGVRDFLRPRSASDRYPALPSRPLSPVYSPSPSPVYSPTPPPGATSPHAGEAGEGLPLEAAAEGADVPPWPLLARALTDAELVTLLEWLTASGAPTGEWCPTRAELRALESWYVHRG